MIIDFYNRGGGSGGGVTSGEVQTMIDESISGKADTSAVTDVSEEVETKQTLYTATTLSDITNPKEGDVAVVVTSGGTSWIEISPEDFDDICQEDKWVRGATYKVTGDTAETYTANKAIRGAFVTTGETETSVYLGFGFRKNVGYGFEFGDSQSWTAWDGSERTFTVPEDYDEWQLYMYNSPDEVVTVFQQTGSTPSQTQYQRVNGEWVEPASKAYVNNVVGDIETALASI